MGAADAWEGGLVVVAVVFVAVTSLADCVATVVVLVTAGMGSATTIAASGDKERRNFFGDSATYPPPPPLLLRREREVAWWCVNDTRPMPVVMEVLLPVLSGESRMAANSV